jgi:hypothetical protein
VEGLTASRVRCYEEERENGRGGTKRSDREAGRADRVRGERVIPGRRKAVIRPTYEESIYRVIGRRHRPAEEEGNTIETPSFAVALLLRAAISLPAAWSIGAFPFEKLVSISSDKGRGACGERTGTKLRFIRCPITNP